MYDEANYAKSGSFFNETKEKSENFRDMKAQIYCDPIKRKSHRDGLIDKLCDLKTIDDAQIFINMEHEPLYLMALEHLGKCHDA
ncbi:MAG: hypothetical protein ABW092_11730 [Candidatus Thiodiazotropha sp.]